MITRKHYSICFGIFTILPCHILYRLCFSLIILWNPETNSHCKFSQLLLSRCLHYKWPQLTPMQIYSKFSIWMKDTLQIAIPNFSIVNSFSLSTDCYSSHSHSIFNLKQKHHSNPWKTSQAQCKICDDLVMAIFNWDSWPDWSRYLLLCFIVFSYEGLDDFVMQSNWRWIGLFHDEVLFFLDPIFRPNLVCMQIHLFFCLIPEYHFFQKLKHQYQNS